jgi:hypothetical protein
VDLRYRATGTKLDPVAEAIALLGDANDPDPNQRGVLHLLGHHGTGFVVGEDGLTVRLPKRDPKLVAGIEALGEVVRPEPESEREWIAGGARLAGGTLWAEILVAAMGAGGALTVLMQILRGWAERYKLTNVEVELPDGTKLEIESGSIDSVGRLFEAKDARHVGRAIDAPADPARTNIPPDPPQMIEDNRTGQELGRPVPLDDPAAFRDVRANRCVRQRRRVRCFLGSDSYAVAHVRSEHAVATDVVRDEVEEGVQRPRRRTRRRGNHAERPG